MRKALLEDAKQFFELQSIALYLCTGGYELHAHLVLQHPE